jgi:hypothetical protein
MGRDDLLQLVDAGTTLLAAAHAHVEPAAATAAHGPHDADPGDEDTQDEHESDEDFAPTHRSRFRGSADGGAAAGWQDDCMDVLV